MPVVDPDVPYARSEEGMTDLHYRWAENHMVDFIQQANIAAYKVYRLKGKDPAAMAESTASSNGENTRRGSGNWPKSLRGPFASLKIK